MVNRRKMRERREEKSLANKEAYNRMNFLYQASQTVLMENPGNVELSRFYAFTMKNIGQKLLCKIDPSIKRTICKYCHAVLVPGLTSTVRVKAKREQHMVVKCLACRTSKRFNMRKNHQLWSEQKQDNMNEQQKAPCSKPEQKMEQKPKGQFSKQEETMQHKGLPHAKPNFSKYW